VKKLGRSRDDIRKLAQGFSEKCLRIFCLHPGAKAQNVEQGHRPLGCVHRGIRWQV
jgi:hypothetical protein